MKIDFFSWKTYWAGVAIAYFLLKDFVVIGPGFLKDYFFGEKGCFGFCGRK